MATYDLGQPAATDVEGIHYRTAYRDNHAIALWDYPDAVEVALDAKGQPSTSSSTSSATRGGRCGWRTSIPAARTGVYAYIAHLGRCFACHSGFGDRADNTLSESRECQTHAYRRTAD